MLGCTIFAKRRLIYIIIGNKIYFNTHIQRNWNYYSKHLKIMIGIASKKKLVPASKKLQKDFIASRNPPHPALTRRNRQMMIRIWPFLS